MLKIKKITNKLSKKVFNSCVFKYFAKLSITRKRQFVFVGVIVAILIASTIIILAANNKGDSPYIYLKMDEGNASTTYDSSGNANTGALNGGAAWKNEEECMSGKCLYLDGASSYVSVPDFSLE